MGKGQSIQMNGVAPKTCHKKVQKTTTKNTSMLFRCERGLKEATTPV